MHCKNIENPGEFGPSLRFYRSSPQNTRFEIEEMFPPWAIITTLGWKPELWPNSCRHCGQLVDEAWVNDGLQDKMIDKSIIEIFAGLEGGTH